MKITFSGGFEQMSKWCDTCSRNKITGELRSCSKDCPAFGKHHEELAEIVIRQQKEIEALRWTNTTLIKTEKKKRRKLWNKAVNQFAEKLRNGHSIESIIEEMTT